MNRIHIKVKMIPATMRARLISMKTLQTPRRMLTACEYWRNAGMTTKAAENLKIVATTIIPIRMMNPSSTTQYPSSQRSTGSKQDFQECHGLSHVSIVVGVSVYAKKIE